MDSITLYKKKNNADASIDLLTTCYSLFPSSPGPFLGLVSEALSVRSEQRGHGPCVVHCLSGVGRSGLFLLAVAAVCHVHAVRTLPDLVILAAHIAAWRKNPLRDREHFKFAYQLLLYYGQDLLMKREYFWRLALKDRNKLFSTVGLYWLNTVLC